MKKIDNFVNRYSVSKTLRFKAIPIGKTGENIAKKRLIEEDEERAEKYKKAKKIIDRYHIFFIDKVLDNTLIEGLDRYIYLFNKRDKSEEEQEEIRSFEMNSRKQISRAFKSDPAYKNLFDKTLIEDILPRYLNDSEEKDVIKSFVGFKTAFEGFNENRANMYSEEEQSTAISYRCINDNLPRFISNLNCFGKISEAFDKADMERFAKELDIGQYRIEDLFKAEFFNFVLSNRGISFYNKVLNGFVTENNQKIQGLNEHINLFNQQLSKDDKSKRVPLLKPLYKQVLAENNSYSFYDDGYHNVQELLDDLKSEACRDSVLYKAVFKLRDLVDSLNSVNPAKVFVSNGSAITELSKGVSGSWSVFRDNWNKEYDYANMQKTPQNFEKYEEKRRKAYNAEASFSISDIAKRLITEEKCYGVLDICFFYQNGVNEQIKVIEDLSEEIASLTSRTDENSSITAADVSLVKTYLDAFKTIETLIKPLLGSEREPDRDEVFYGELTEMFDSLRIIDSLYNRVRNYVTKKPFSTDKFKLYFQNPQFMGGWDRNKVSDYRATLMRKDGKYYLAVLDKGNSKILDRLDQCDSGNYYEILDYKLIPGASKQLPHIFFSSKGIAEYNPSAEVCKIYKEGTFKKGPEYKKTDCHKVINYYKDAISQHEWNDIYNFTFSPTDSYEDISGFFKEVDSQGYRLSFYKVSDSQIDALVEEGKVFLFQVYCKDFSQYSHGNKNLHTMLFEQLFDEKNGGLLKLCGGAELFMRRASVNKDKLVVHRANEQLKNKNPLNPKRESIFKYDLIKDKRYSEDQYEIHIPITVNRTASEGTGINNAVRNLLSSEDNPYVIGIDRGERNLLYVCVVDGEGRIVEQFSLNDIVNEYKGVKIKTDYHELLSRKEEERLKARQNWTTIENIKELKEGYISQVIHKICQLVVKYDAVIAMEDLNSGFKNSRVKVEKQVYQKFEKALIDKFNYMADKSLPLDENGSVIHGYQLAESFKSFKSMGTQNGFIFYIPAWLTSKIDPVTGFADLIKPKYISIADARDLIKQFDGIRFSPGENMFEIALDYEKFPRADADFTKKWKIYTNGKRIRTFRNPNKNGEWDNEEVLLVDAYKTLFDKWSISFSDGNDLRTAICAIEDKAFYVEFIELLKLTLQMRNSVTGRTDVDYLISPVKGPDGSFYCSNDCSNTLPRDADANGAYNIARKVLWAINQFKTSEDCAKTKIAISNKEWLEYAQSQ